MYRIGAQSLWYDEGTSATVAPRDIATIIANAANDIHPPLYYLLLHFWVFVAIVRSPIPAEGNRTPVSPLPATNTQK